MEYVAGWSHSLYVALKPGKSINVTQTVALRMLLTIYEKKCGQKYAMVFHSSSQMIPNSLTSLGNSPDPLSHLVCALFSILSEGIIVLSVLSLSFCLFFVCLCVSGVSSEHISRSAYCMGVTEVSGLGLCLAVMMQHHIQMLSLPLAFSLSFTLSLTHPSHPSLCLSQQCVNMQGRCLCSQTP